MDYASTSIDDPTPAIAYKPRRRASGQPKATSRPKATPTRRPVKLLLEPEIYEQLVIGSLRSGDTISDIINKLVRTNYMQWAIHARPGGSKAE